jgi:hypothetical protein
MLSPRLARAVRRLLAAALLVAALGTPATASASCVMLPDDGAEPWAGADAVFVGTVTAVANGNRWATVRVEEVWQGPDQPAEVVVRGGPEGDMATSVDRSYAVGVQYVFAVAISDGQLQDNACSGTTPTDAINLEAVRPDDVRQPDGAILVSSGDVDYSGLAGPLLVAAIVVGLLLVTVFVVGRREA